MEKITQFKVHDTEKKMITTNLDGLPMEEILLIFGKAVLADRGIITEEALQKTVQVVKFLEWTGKKDAHGIKIFDKDIVDLKVPNEFGSFMTVKALIGWCEHQLGWAAYPYPFDENADHAVLGSVLPIELKVVGNSLDNPELLTGAKDGK